MPFLMPNEPGEDAAPIDYEIYIRSPEWKQRAHNAIVQAGSRCQLCLRVGSRTGNVHLNVHHLTYRALGNESSSDLAVLCQDCHNLIHRTRVSLEEAKAIYARARLWQYP